MTAIEQLKAALDALPLAKGRYAPLRISNGRASVILDATGLSPSERQRVEQQVAALKIRGIDTLRVLLTAERPERRLIAVASGKGGVGKSTLSANLAVALAKTGLHIGLIDADIYGPSQPTLFGIEGRRPSGTDKQLQPTPTGYGVAVLSIGQMVQPGKALAWRGPMAGNALGQLLDADWGDADLILVDMPPGTGDVQLSMLQKQRPAGALIVSTPQDLALIDAARAIDLFNTAGVPVLGMVENMAGYCCPHCQGWSDPFGRGGAEQAAAERKLSFLGRIPLTLAIRERSDGGAPIAAGTGVEAEAFDLLAAELLKELDHAARA